jgi:hypothetical protein
MAVVRVVVESIAAVALDSERVALPGWARGWCEGCGGPVAASKKAGARFCSRSCQRASTGV